MISAYVDGRLPDQQREALEAHLSQCDDCYFLVRETGRAVEDLDRRDGRGRRSAGPVSLRYALPTAATLVVGLGGVLVWRHLQPSPADAAVAPLVEALGQRRVFEPRLAGGFLPGPLAAPKRGGVPEADRWPLLAAATQIRARTLAEPKIENRQALAAAHLLLGEMDAAVQILEELAVAAPRDPRISNDLAAAYLVRAREKGRAEDYPRALEVASIAAELAPGWPEAWFNKALALEALNLVGEARAAWAACRAVTPPGDGWAEVVADHVRRLEAAPQVDKDRVGEALWHALDRGAVEEMDRIVTSSVESSRLFFEERLLPPLRGDDRLSTIERMRTFGDRFRIRTGDASISRLAGLLAGNAEDDGLARLHAEYAEARRLYRQDRWREAGRLFEDLKEPLETAGSPLAPWAALHIAILDYQAGRTAESEARLRSLRRDPSAAVQPLLLGRVEWMLGLIEVGRGGFDSAVRAYAAGRKHFEDAGDLVHAAYMDEQTGEVFGYLGRHGLGWGYRVQALGRLREFPEVKRRVMVLVGCGDHCRNGGWIRAAMSLHREARSVAATGTPRDVADSELSLARTAASDPRVRSASLARARRVIDGLRDVDVRERVFGEYQRIVAETVDLEADDGSAVLDQAIAWLSDRDARARVAPLHLRRGQWLSSRGETEAAARDFHRVIELCSGSRAPADDLLASYAQLGVAAYDELLASEARFRDPLDGLALAEGRWRISDDAGAPERDRLASLASTLHADSVVLAFVPLPHALLSWSVSGGELHRSRVRISRNELDGLVTALRTSLQGNASDVDVAARLYSLLVGPHEPALTGRSRLFVVPAGTVARLPFGALRDGGGARLADRVSVAFVPSLGFLLERGFARALSREAMRVFSFGFASGSEDLPRLARAEAEAIAVVGHLGGGDAITGRGATADVFVTGARTARVVHFAGHAVANPERPQLSSLVVSDGAGGDGHLTARRIEGLDLRHVRLVMLSACSASGSAAEYGEGTLTLARPFLNAGADAVIGPLWDVSDRGMPEVSARLYESIRRGATPAQAVSDVQRWAESRGGPAAADARSLVTFTAEGALGRPLPSGRRRGGEDVR
jgi:CHAT domain-containing protein